MPRVTQRGRAGTGAHFWRRQALFLIRCRTLAEWQCFPEPQSCRLLGGSVGNHFAGFRLRAWVIPQSGSRGRPGSLHGESLWMVLADDRQVLLPPAFHRTRLAWARPSPVPASSALPQPGAAPYMFTQLPASSLPMHTGPVWAEGRGAHSQTPPWHFSVFSPIFKSRLPQEALLDCLTPRHLYSMKGKAIT